MTDLTNPMFIDANAAREHLERLYWPNGPVCRHCGNAEAKRITKLSGKSTRPGVFWCNECDKPFSVTVGTVMEDSKIPLNKWVLAFHLMSASKKGMSAHQLHRMLGVSYKTAWFLAHRIREAMDGPSPASGGGLGGEGKIIEVDETYVGGKGNNRAHRKSSPKKAVVSLIERDGRVASFHVANVTAETVRPIIMTHANRKSALMSDESNVYTKLGREFASHHSVRSLTRRIRLFRQAIRLHRVHQHQREFLQHLQARNHRRLSFDKRSALASLSRRVRLSIQQSLKARRRGYGTRHQSDAGRGRKAPHLLSACCLKTEGQKSGFGRHQRKLGRRLILGVGGFLLTSLRFWRAALARLSDLHLGLPLVRRAERAQ